MAPSGEAAGRLDGGVLPILVLLAAQTVVPSDQSAPVPSEVHVFEDWVVACDNGRRCQAVGVQPEGREFDGAGVMVIERGAEADAQPTVRLTDVEGLPERLSVHEEALGSPRPSDPSLRGCAADAESLGPPGDRGRVLIP